MCTMRKQSKSQALSFLHELEITLLVLDKNQSKGVHKIHKIHIYYKSLIG